MRVSAKLAQVRRSSRRHHRRGALHSHRQVWQPSARLRADYPRGSDSSLLFPSLKEFITSGTKF
ncbi:hypothetical protein [Arthrobacter sp. DR-2P]|nr:hypothetical protein [Arthrobacter sp. DR-2P]